MVQSAAGLISLLDETELDLISYSLIQLNQIIHNFWSIIADQLVKIESLSENTKFKHRHLASLIASKVYYHLQNYDEALTFALGANHLFNLDQLTSTDNTNNNNPTEREYLETIVSKAIDTYVKAKSAPVTPGEVIITDPRLEAIVERMFERCERDGEYKQALGISLSSHRLDIIQRIFKLTQDASLLEWVLNVVVREGVVGGTGRAYKIEVLHLLITLFSSLESPDYFSITQCFVYLDDPSLASKLLSELLSLGGTTPASEENVLIAYQIAFDLAETAGQGFLEIVRNELSGQVVEIVEPVAGVEAIPVEGSELNRQRVVAILTGEESIRLYLEFLYRNNHADLLILKGTKDALESRNSIYHSAVTFMNAFANAGTTSDLFLRENLDWLAKASNWSKFSATAALGVIHKGNLAQGMAILDPYLPKPNSGSTSFYSEGGSLFALGLVNSNHGSKEVLSYLKEALKSGVQNEVIQHGAALGLGVAAMGSGNEEIYEELRNVLFNDSAIAGEAAGYAMGLVMLGTASDKALDEMLQYAHETQHEKIIRGLAVGIAFLMFGKEEEADVLIERLLADADAILRYGGIYTIAMAYAGTGNNKAIRLLLHVAVSDVNDDVRRAAVTSLGYLLFRNPTQVPRIVQLLSESYNPNVRYGAALALGISCAGTGLEDAISLLEPLTKDPIDFVRQGACISLSMILIQQNEASNPKVASTRAIYTKIIGDKHEDAMAKFGAAVSQGLIDAGGRNVTISLTNSSGGKNREAIVGMALFAQFWYWFPMAHCVALTFTPTAVIGVNSDLKIPKFEFTSNAKPSLFAYQPATKPPTKEVVEKVATAVLSTTAKATARAKRAKEDAMDTDEKVEEEKKDEEMKIDEATPLATGDATAPPAATTKPKRKAAEPTSERLANLTRVTPAQLSHISFPADSRYVPVRSIFASTSASASTSAVKSTSTRNTLSTGGGILMMKDREPTKEAEFLEMEVTRVLQLDEPAPAVVPAGAAALVVDDGPIAEMPAAFEYSDWE